MARDYYRPEIDGLRAIAILSVIIHHYDLPFLKSGFAGVDVFFVISGYLVGGMVLEKFNSNEFNFLDFYKKRFIRIAPALFAMLALSAIFAYFILLPNELRYFGGGIISAIASLSNIWFYNRINYFNPDVNQEPLIHTWSLGVEEQFYIFFPILIYTVIKIYNSKIIAALCVTIIASILSMVYLSTSNPDASFYFPHTRFWEFGLGAITSKYQRFIYEKFKKYGKYISTISLFCLILTLSNLNAHNWPNTTTILPVFFTILVLIFGNLSLTKINPLNILPIVFIGRISYSLYLYHQPILSFTNLTITDKQGLNYWSLLISSTFIISFLSWKYIEKPFISNNVKKPTKILIIYTLPLALIIFSLLSNFNAGFPNRLNNETRNFISYKNSYSDTYKKCLNNRKDINLIDINKTCIHGDGTEPKIAIWGDSHAAVLANPLSNLLSKDGLPVKELTMSSCAPIINLYMKDWNRGEACVQWNNDVFNYLIKSQSISTIVINANWKTYLEINWRLQPKNGWENIDALIDYEELIIKRINQQLNDLSEAGKKIILITPIPTPDKNLINSYAHKIKKDENYKSNEYTSYSKYLESTDRTNRIISKIKHVTLVKSENKFCLNTSTDDQCLVIENGIPLYFDEAHLSLPGVAKIINEINIKISENN
jgi:peptidoglycan/LPS O-acetylase OafA/YrhL